MQSRQSHANQLDRHEEGVTNLFRYQFCVLKRPAMSNPRCMQGMASLFLGTQRPDVSMERFLDRWMKQRQGGFSFFDFIIYQL